MGISRAGAVRAFLLLVAAVGALLLLGHGQRAPLSTRSTAGTTVCGEVDGTWSAASAPYYVCPQGITTEGLVLDGSAGGFSVLAEGAGGITVYDDQDQEGLSTRNTTASTRITFDSATSTAAGAWAGLSWDYPDMTYAPIDLAHVDIRHAVHGLASNDLGKSVSLDDVSITSTSDTAISLTSTPLTVTDAVITSSGGAGIVDAWDTSTAFYDTDEPSVVSITGTSVTGADGAGIDLEYAEFPVVQGNVVRGSGLASPVSPAIIVHAQDLDLTAKPPALRLGTDISGNTGGGNGIDAIAVSGMQQGGFTWLTPTDSNTTHALGYLNEGLEVQGAGNVDFPAGSVVKSGTPTTHLDNEPVTNPGITSDSSSITATVETGTVFTSLEDDSVGPATCRSSLSPTCTPVAGQWDGLSTFGALTVTGATFRWGASELATNTDLPASQGASGAARVSGSTFSDCLHSFGRQLAFDVVDATGVTLTRCDLEAETGTLEQVAGSASSMYVGVGYSFMPTGPDVLNGVTTTNGTVQIDGRDPQVGNVTVTGFTEASPAVVVGGTELRVGPGDDVDTSTIRGSANVLNALGLDGTFDTDLTWVTPAAASTPAALGFLGLGDVDLGSHTLVVPAHAVVQATELSTEGGTIDASAGGATFAGLQDAQVGYPVSQYSSNLWFDLADAGSSGSRLTVVGGTLRDLTGAYGYDDGETYDVDYPGVYVDDPAGTASVSITDSSLAAPATGTSVLVDGGSTVLTGDTLQDAWVEADAGTLAMSRSALTEARGEPFLVADQAAHVTVDTSSFDAGGRYAYPAYAVSVSGSASLAMTCSSVKGDDGGVRTTTSGSVSFDDGDLYGNAYAASGAYPAAYDVDDPSGQPTFVRDWWGQSGGPVAGQISHPENATVTEPASTQAPAATLVLSGSAYRSDGTIGPGELDVTATLSRRMDTSTPLTVALVDSHGAQHPVFGSWTGPTTWSGSLVLDATSHVDGTDSVRASNARGCVPDPSTNAMPTTTTSVSASGTGSPLPAPPAHGATPPARHETRSAQVAGRRED